MSLNISAAAREQRRSSINATTATSATSAIETNEPNNNTSSVKSSAFNSANQRPQLTRKRSSIQSNMSSLANGGGGGGGSLHSSGSCSAASTATSGDDLESDNKKQQQATSTTSSADYEHIRNTTLLFFLDRLYLASREGKEARTLQDLSCLFGTKEFTKEMRQIVGASRNGLKKFLQSYPSLFQLEDDKVYLTQLKPAGTSQRDYNQEAVDYFKLKLTQFGTSLVPVKNLFGYRSQASQEVRHVSGKNARDFKRFLRQNEQVFEILADEHVVLRSALAELELQGQSSLALEQSLQPLQPDEAIVTDPYLNKQFAHLIEECVQQMRREELEAKRLSELEQFSVTLEVLHERIRSQCKNELFLKMVKSSNDLKVFLRMHPKLFKRFKCDQGRDCVRLLSELERKELEQASQAHHSAQLMRQHSTLGLTSAPTTSLTLDQSRQPADSASWRRRQSADQQVSPPAPLQQVNGSSQHVSSNQLKSTISSQQQPRAPPQKSLSQQSARSQQQQLRAAAPPFVPSKPTRQNSSLASNNRSSQQMQQRQPMMAPRSQSNVTARSMQASHANNHPASQQEHPRGRLMHQNAQPVDQRRAIRSYLMRGNAQPASHNSSSNNMNWVSKSDLRGPLPSTATQVQSRMQQAPSANNPPPPQPPSESELRARTVDIVREASNIITRIMTTTDAVAFDCKGYNLGFDGQITLIQFGYLPTKSSNPMRALNNNNNDQRQQPESGRIKPEVCVFDLITNPELAYCLKPLLESDKIVKIVHDVRNKSNALHVQFNIILNNVFDTQVANLVIQQQETGKPAYKSRYISMSKLCEIYGDEELLKYRNIIKYKTRHANNGGEGPPMSLNSTSGSGGRSIKDVNYWRTRPLSKPMIFEATMDVYCLVGGIYQNLKTRLKPEYEPLFSQLNLEGVLARIKPEEIRSAKKERKIDLEVIDLKRKLYSDSTGPVVLSNREIRLLRHIDLTPEVRQKIQQCKKVAKKLERLDMKAAQLLEGGEGDQQQIATNSELLDGGQQSLTSNSQMSSMVVDNLETGASSLSEQQKLEASSFASKLDEFQATGVMSNLMDSSMFDELKDKMIESSSLLESLEDDDDEDASLSLHHHHHHHHHNSGQNGHSLNHDCCGCQCHRSSIGDKDSVPSLGASLSSTSSGAEIAVKSENSSLLEAPKEDQKTTKTSEAATCTSETNTNAKTTADAATAIDLKTEITSAVGDQLQPSVNQTTKVEEMKNKEKEEEEELKKDFEDEFQSSLACDMAVQCDLLS